MEPPRDVQMIAACLLALLVVAGTAVILVIVVRCTFAFVSACERDIGLHEIFAEMLVVLMALITRPKDRP
jgi:hypothetical protein